MMISISRRAFMIGTGALGANALLLTSPRAASREMNLHGLSSFGDLLLPPDFKYFPYVNPNALKGGTLSLQLSATSGNQAFDTFNTLNIFTFRGQGAAGMDMTFDSLMAVSLDEPDACYGLVAKSVNVSSDRLTYRFYLRPEARFHDGSPLTAEDVAFSFNTLKNHENVFPTYRLMLRDMIDAVAETPEILSVTFAPTRSRDLHLIIATLPIFSKKYYQDRDFGTATLEAPLASGPYQVNSFEQGRYIEFSRVKNYWGISLPVNVGINNFDTVKFEYFRDRQVAFEAFKGGLLTFRQEATSRLWATGYNFPAAKDGRVTRRSIDSEMPVTAQGWRYNLRRSQFKDIRIREAIALAFDFEWTNTTIMYSSFKRTTSYFENSAMKASGLPSVQEIALLEPYRKDIPQGTFQEAYIPPVSNGSGQDRALLRKADQLLGEAGCKRDGRTLRLPDGTPFTIEFLDFQSALQPHTEALIANLRRLGIEANLRVVDASQYQQRLKNFDFDIISLNLGGSTTPGDSLRLVYGSKAAETPGSLNYSGISNPAVDAMIDKISDAKSRDELTLSCQALDRVLRSSHYWIPMWYLGTTWAAWWDMYDQPVRTPRFSAGAPTTWWYNPEKAKKIGKA